MQIKINDYYEPEHYRAICEDNYNISRTCEYEKNEMHHIHNTCEILLVESGSADYYVQGEKYFLEKNDILVIGAMEHHFRRIQELPFLRYGFTIKPTYYRNIIVDSDLLKVFDTPTPQNFVLHHKNIDSLVFDRIVELLIYLKKEEVNYKSFRSLIERTVITQIAIELFRVTKLDRINKNIGNLEETMKEIKDYVDINFKETIDLERLSEKFFLHPTTISKEFSIYCGNNLNKYINKVRVCEAAKLLETTHESVENISEKCGFGSLNTFLRQFKTIMEISPLQYRKSIHSFWNRNEKS